MLHLVFGVNADIRQHWDSLAELALSRLRRICSGARNPASTSASRRRLTGSTNSASTNLATETLGQSAPRTWCNTTTAGTAQIPRLPITEGMRGNSSTRSVDFACRC